MMPSSIFLRVLLCAALILNGIGSAVASARMIGAASATPADVHAHAAMAAPEHSHGACHEQAAVTSPDGDGNATDPGHHGKQGADCCQTGACACHCAQQAPVAFVPPVLAAPHLAHAASVRAMSPAHESPPLPHLIRPPILQSS